MQGKKPATLLVMAVITFGILISGTTAYAQDVCGPDFNQLSQITVGKTGALAVNPATGIYVKFYGPFEFVCSPGLCSAPSGVYWRWIYQLQNSSGLPFALTPISNVQFFVPAKNDQCDLNNEYFDSSSGKPGAVSILAPPGNYTTSGGENPYWRFVFERQILKITSDDSSSPPIGVPNGPFYSFFTKSKSKPKTMSFYIKSGSTEYVAQTLGPSTPDPLPRLSTLHSTCENIRTGSDASGLPIPLENPFSIKTTINESNCDVTVTIYSDVDCTGSTTEVQPSNMGLTFDGISFAALECGSENQSCPMCELRGHRNPCSITKYASGRPYLYCYNCTTGLQVSCSSP